MNNRWNTLIYKAWSPVYDKVFDSGVFLTARRQLFADAHGRYWQAGQDVLFVGVGTGADLAYIDHSAVTVTAIDYSKDMLAQAKQKYAHTDTRFLQMDAQAMDFADASFDTIVASLVLSVVPDAAACFEEMLRVLKPNGYLIIFDKFLPKDGKLSPLKRAAKPVIQLLGTDISVRFEHLYAPYQDVTHIKEDTPLLFGGMYRKIIVQKIAATERA